MRNMDDGERTKSMKIVATNIVTGRPTAMLQLLPILWKSGSFYRFNKMIVLVKYQIFSAPAIPDMNARGKEEKL